MVRRLVLECVGARFTEGAFFELGARFARAQNLQHLGKGLILEGFTLFDKSWVSGLFHKPARRTIVQTPVVLPRRHSGNSAVDGQERTGHYAGKGGMMLMREDQMR